MDDATYAPDLAAPGGAWLLVRAALLPERWAPRAVELRGVWLDARELAELAEQRIDDPLPPEQRELVPLLAEGLSPVQVARALHVSPRTAQRRIARLRARLGARSHAELVALLARTTP
jgi:DNA-binding NarL/FixJ family response regulator